MLIDQMNEIAVRFAGPDAARLVSILLAQLVRKPKLVPWEKLSLKAVWLLLSPAPLLPTTDLCRMLQRWLPTTCDPESPEAVATWRSNAGLDTWLGIVDLVAGWRRAEIEARGVILHVANVGIHVFDMSQANPPTWLPPCSTQSRGSALLWLHMHVFRDYKTAVGLLHVLVETSHVVP